MTREEKQLLLKDLCTRLPYGVICHTEEGDGHLCSIVQTIFGTEYGLNINPLKRDYFNDSETDEQAVKPYLRPMPNMTSDERIELSIILNYEFYVDEDFALVAEDDRHRIRLELCKGYIDWLNSHHFDYRGLIENGLALEAPEGMYNKLKLKFNNYVFK